MNPPFYIANLFLQILWYCILTYLNWYVLFVWKWWLRN